MFKKSMDYSSWFLSKKIMDVHGFDQKSWTIVHGFEQFF